MEENKKVINLFEEKEQPHLAGKCFCIACRHEWEGCCPVGVTDLECPSCHSMKGRMKFEVVRIEDHWKCNCGNTFFSVTPTCLYCPNCGLKQNPYD